MRSTTATTVATLLLLLLGCGPACASKPPDAPAGGEGVPQTVTFVHISDLHANYNPDPSDGGISPASRLRGYHESVLVDNPDALFIDSGDDHEKGSLAELLTEGQATVEVVRAMEFDVRVLGNHDLAWGEKGLLEAARDEHAIVLASNTEDTSGAGFGAVDYAERQIGELKIGFFGMVSRPWNEKNEQYDGPFFAGDRFVTRYDYADRAREIVAAHRDEVDLLVMVSHLGVKTDEQLAREVDGIDVILGGHSHQVMDVPLVIAETIIVHPGAYAERVGRLDLTVDPGSKEIGGHSWTLHEVDGSMPVDPEVQQAVETTLAGLDLDILDPATTLKSPQGKLEIAALTATAARETLAADAALVDLETVWSDWEPGALSPQQMLDTYKVERQPADTPGFNSFYLVEVDGAELQHIAGGLKPGWSFGGPDAISSDATYTLALQKHAAFNPEAYLPAGVTISTPRFGMEAWEVLYRRAKKRTGDCRYFDVDDGMTGCEVGGN